MKLGIVGYGKMGTMVHRAALDRGHEVTVIVDHGSRNKAVTHRCLDSTAELLDVIIDFSRGDAVVENIKHYARIKTNAVIGTTGWYDDLNRVEGLVLENELGLIWSANFSLGVNIFFQLVRAAAKTMNRFSHYDAMVEESHHRYKADSPSGTGHIIGEIIVSELDRKTETVSGGFSSRGLKECELHVSSTRGGYIPGTHRVIFDSEVDTIVLEHVARNRSGFALGAIVAAEWIRGRKGFYSTEQMMKAVVGGEAGEQDF